jgi:tetratricopeptide (TPR) repeat protein
MTENNKNTTTTTEDEAIQQQETIKFDDRIASALALKEQGNVLFKNGEYKKAAQCYRRIFGHINGLVAPGSGMEQYSKSVMNSDQVNQVQEIKATVYRNLAMVYVKTQEWSRVVEMADKALEIKEKDAKSHLRKGQALIALHMFDRAKTSLIRASQLEPKDPIVANELQRWQVEYVKWTKESAAKEKAAFGGKLL